MPNKRMAARGITTPRPILAPFQMSAFACEVFGEGLLVLKLVCGKDVEDGVEVKVRVVATASVVVSEADISDVVVVTQSSCGGVVDEDGGSK
jgi:hypothetical protein